MGTRSRIYGTRVQWWARTCSNCWCGSPFTALGLEEHGFRTSTFLPPTFSSESAGLEALQRQRWYLVCVPPAPSTASGKASTVCWIAFLEGLTQSVTQCQPSGARKGPRHLVPPGVFSGCPQFHAAQDPSTPAGSLLGESLLGIGMSEGTLRATECGLDTQGALPMASRGSSQAG